MLYEKETIRFVGGAVALLCVVGALSLAAVHAESGAPADTSATTASGYKLDRQSALYRGTAITSADSSTVDATSEAAIPVFAALGRQNLPLSARFSVAAQSTTVQYVALWNSIVAGTGTNWILGCSAKVTLTATDLVDDAGRYMAPTYVFDSFGSSHGRIYVRTAPASGNVKFALGSY